jgi:predicted transcriptional regulator
MTGSAHLSVRVPAALKAELQRLAAAEHRRLADYVHHALQQHVEASTRKRRPAAKTGGLTHDQQPDCGMEKAGAHRSHGLRKAAAVRVAENRGTVDELKAIFGWRTNKQPELYVAEANRRRLGSGAPDLLARPKRERDVSQI